VEENVEQLNSIKLALKTRRPISEDIVRGRIVCYPEGEVEVRPTISSSSDGGSH
jgi:hypothetical protein